MHPTTSGNKVSIVRKRSVRYGGSSVPAPAPMHTSKSHRGYAPSTLMDLRPRSSSGTSSLSSSVATFSTQGSITETKDKENEYLADIAAGEVRAAGGAGSDGSVADVITAVTDPAGGTGSALVDSRKTLDMDKAKDALAGVGDCAGWTIGQRILEVFNNVDFGTGVSELLSTELNPSNATLKPLDNGAWDIIKIHVSRTNRIFQLMLHPDKAKQLLWKGVSAAHLFTNYTKLYRILSAAITNKSFKDLDTVATTLEAADSAPTEIDDVGVAATLAAAAAMNEMMDTLLAEGNAVKPGKGAIPVTPSAPGTTNTSYSNADGTVIHPDSISPGTLDIAAGMYDVEAAARDKVDSDPHTAVTPALSNSGAANAAVPYNFSPGTIDLAAALLAASGAHTSATPPAPSNLGAGGAITPPHDDLSPSVIAVVLKELDASSAEVVRVETAAPTNSSAHTAATPAPSNSVAGSTRAMSPSRRLSFTLTNSADRTIQVDTHASEDRTSVLVVSAPVTDEGATASGASTTVIASSMADALQGLAATMATLEKRRTEGKDTTEPAAPAPAPLPNTNALVATASASEVPTHTAIASSITEALGALAATMTSLERHTTEARDAPTEVTELVTPAPVVSNGNALAASTPVTSAVLDETDDGSGDKLTGVLGALAATMAPFERRATEARDASAEASEKPAAPVTDKSATASGAPTTVIASSMAGALQGLAATMAPLEKRATEARAAPAEAPEKPAAPAPDESATASAEAPEKPAAPAPAADIKTEKQAAQKYLNFTNMIAMQANRLGNIGWSLSFGASTKAKEITKTFENLKAKVRIYADNNNEDSIEFQKQMLTFVETALYKNNPIHCPPEKKDAARTALIAANQFCAALSSGRFSGNGATKALDRIKAIVRPRDPGAIPSKIYGTRYHSLCEMVEKQAGRLRGISKWSLGFILSGSIKADKIKGALDDLKQAVLKFHKETNESSSAFHQTMVNITEEAIFNKGQVTIVCDAKDEHLAKSVAKCACYFYEQVAERRSWSIFGGESTVLNHMKAAMLFGKSMDPSPIKVLEEGPALSRSSC